jgi:predicted MFS family arabinose efflux permease
MASALRDAALDRNAYPGRTAISGLSGRPLIAAMCVGQVGNLLPHVVVPAILSAHLIPLWGLSAAEAGLMASGYAFGYMFAVPVLTALTDRIDARRILLLGSLVSALATIAFGFLAQGFWSATAIWSVAGIGFAGAYMPGLKALTDRLPSENASRAITLYTSSFSLGVGLSFLLAQLVADAWGWRAAFLVTGLGPIAMIAACLALDEYRPQLRPGSLLDVRPVLRNRVALGYIFGYGAHCFELYGIRTWIVGFWSFVVANHTDQGFLTPVIVSFVFTLLAMPASILGNEAALRVGRHRAISLIMVASACIALAIGLNAGARPVSLLPLLLLYALTVPADSGALTAGMAASASPTHRGATMALHSTVGFGLSAAGAWGIGVAIDAAGGLASTSGWLAGFSVLAAGIALGPLVLWWSRSSAEG